MSNEIDIRENDILQQDPVLLDTLLIDRSRPNMEFFCICGSTIKRSI